MALKDFINHTNTPYDSLNDAQRTLVDVIDYANEHNIAITVHWSRGGCRSNILDIYKQMQTSDKQKK